MRRVLAAVVCCCLLAGAAVAVPSAGDGQSARPAVPATNTSAYLTITPDALETASYRRASLDVSGTLTLDTRRLEGQYRQLVLDERFAATESTAKRRAMLRASAARIESRIDELLQRQSAAVGRYNNGTISVREFVIELARIDTAAGRLGAAADRVADRARSIPGSSINGQPATSWARNRRVELGPLRGPVRERIATTLRGQNTAPLDASAAPSIEGVESLPDERLEALDLYVATTSEGVVLATVDEGRHFREAYLPTERANTSAGALTGITAALDRVAERYPWTWNNSASRDASGDRRAGVYRFTLFYDHGRLTTYLDRRSGEVFAEQQRNRLSGVPTADPIRRTSGDLHLTINRTYPTGPLELSLTNRAGEPVDGRITIANHSVGRTGMDGSLWTVAPRNAATVTARANDETVRIETNFSPTENRTATAATAG
jgi:phage FluMu protein gp41